MIVLLVFLGLGASTGVRPAEEPEEELAEETVEASATPSLPSLVLLTLDTTRADHVGFFAAPTSRGSATPVLDSLVARGVRYRRALTPSPLTLPAHASIMTGLEPPEHGVRTNGTTALPKEIPTLASALSEAGYATAAFVASRVLDRRFGLGRGFDLYGDQMTAEKVGEYGYPERDAAAVTSAALSWLESGLAEGPFFLWVHYYDPHAPYEPPDVNPSATLGQRYAGEIAFVDREIGRLLGVLREQSRELVIAVVGDHGESLGEHGEGGHGIFLYGASLEVPLIVAGTGVPTGRVVEDVVSIRRLPATLLELLDPLPAKAARSLGAPRFPGPLLPGIFDDKATSSGHPVYSETRLPATAYGWAPLRSVSDSRWRFIEAPRPELYDLEEDPGETRNVAEQNPDETRRLMRVLKQLKRTMKQFDASPVEQDPNLDAALRSLGYLDSGGDTGSIDPKDGIRLLAEFESAKSLAARGDRRGALAAYQSLVRRNPENVSFLTHLAEAELASGDGEAAVATYTRAVGLNPRLEFLHLNLAEAYRRLGRTEAARRELETVLRLDPRSGVAWLRLAEAAHDAGLAAEERRLLSQAVEAETASGVIHYRLGQIAAEEADFNGADRHFDQAIELIPGWISPWLGKGEVAERRSLFDEAFASYLSAAKIDPGNPASLLGRARVHRAMDERVETRRLLELVLKVAPQSSEANEARKLLAELDEPGQ